MIEVRVSTTKPHHNHPYRSVSIISVCNYDKFQQYDLTPDQYKTTSSALLSNKLINNTNISPAKDVDKYGARNRLLLEMVKNTGNINGRTSQKYLYKMSNLQRDRIL
jgi:hypothetical protein